MACALSSKGVCLNSKNGYVFIGDDSSTKSSLAPRFCGVESSARRIERPERESLERRAELKFDEGRTAALVNESKLLLSASNELFIFKDDFVFILI